MQLVLLSGGSGKRLWPLSNNSRSKQFLRLLENPSGNLESMVQRVIRQINEANINSDVLIATSKSQKDVLESQLGRNVEIITEPERRDTFPAIALACKYLEINKHCDRDEVIVVMPSDSYTTKGYYETISKLNDIIQANVSDVALMGIRPTYPSTKFGYIVPVKDDGMQIHNAKNVEKFTEKPNFSRAEELLREEALWNSGVFAFKLGYLLDIISEYIDVNDYNSFYDRYNELPKISFDYEVVEKAKSIAVIEYQGEWKDLGTWNTLSEELSREKYGNVHFGKDVNNTNVINELDIPVVCHSVNDLIIATSPDGILVCNKKESEVIKDIVNNLDCRPMYEERRWGTYRVISNISYDDGFKSLTKVIYLNAGKCISYQEHKKRTEVWTITDGNGLLLLDGEKREVSRGDVIHISAEQKHSIKAISNMEFIEVQMGTELIEEDIIRYSFDW